jgi:ISXO2-like transposase domain
VTAIVSEGSTLHADEGGHWDALHGKYATHRINHQVAYSLGGACTNQAESFLARLRRMCEGQAPSRKLMQLGWKSLHLSYMPALDAACRRQQLFPLWK